MRGLEDQSCQQAGYSGSSKEDPVNRLLTVTLVGVTALLGGCVHDPPVTLRVLTYNIRHGEGMDGKVDLERIARLIRDAQADLVALQEVDRGVERTNRVDQPGELGRLTGMTAVFEKNIDYQGGQYGNAILSRLPVEFHENHFLPQSLPDEQRGLLEVHVRPGGRKLIFLATHFDYHPDDGERMASVGMLREMVAHRRGVPVIVAGDLNALPESRILAEATEFMTDVFSGAGETGFTFPADTPIRRIDFILHNGHPEVTCVETCVIAEPVASDHRPVLAVFRIDAK
jgi:endonuclease/exonuclease/phosphatase family metal-dependent hydrolase